MHFHAFALSNESENPVFIENTSGIKPSWPLLSLNIAYPMQFLNKYGTITDRTITQFIGQCCQVMSRLKILIKTHPFTCTSYNPFESLHIDHIGPLPVDDKGNSHILVMIDAFSRWVELFPTKTTGASEAAGCIFQHFGRFGTTDVIHKWNNVS